MNFTEYLKKECIEPGIKPTDKISVLREIARIAKKNSLLDNIPEDKIFQELKKREDSTSTGMQHGIAIPHCGIDGVTDFVMGIITIPDGMDFDSLDGQKTKIIVFIIAPESERNEHIRCLSIIARILNSAEKIDEILAIKEPEHILEAMLSRHRFNEISERKEDRSLFTVIVQDHDLFDQILELFTEIEGCSISVIEANNASNYLYALPLFQSFITEEKKGFNRIIIATLDNNHTNEIYSELKSVIEKKKKKTGVMFYVQKIMYHGGSLDL